MSKRFTDTNKYKKPFIRGLQGPYKLFWDYLYHDCDHAGIWIVDFTIAQIYLGSDMPVDRAEAFKLFNNGEVRIVEFSKGAKWFIVPFISFQYGKLSDNNRVHQSVILVLQENDLLKHIKPLTRPLQGRKDKDMDKEKDKDKDKDKDKGGRGIFKPPTHEELLEQIKLKNYQNITPEGFIEFYGKKGWMVGKNKMTDWKLALAAANRWDTTAKPVRDVSQLGVEEAKNFGRPPGLKDGM
jgi:hypothetical protein